MWELGKAACIGSRASWNKSQISTRPHGNLGKTACIGSGGQTKGGMKESGLGTDGVVLGASWH